ncbi:adhesion G-protein coupled receptor F3-like [Astyanax mexicanus]|uniref:Adhesion G-protein coupled receptor F3-like n=1 Tax=Astyanax mexicanus TaxID=7994 RepID=A0A8T2MLG5_ASTMX|nr:adhesion G-protein coupled receptor F3-like [Astyanax mexicanus]
MQLLRNKSSRIQEMCMLLCAILFLYCQISSVGATNQTYIAEVMIEGNASLDVSAFLAGLQWLATDTATIMEATLIAQCEIIGDETTCWCENGYIWSDVVCDSVKTCCNTVKCVANISDYTPLCVPKVNVSLVGTIDTALLPADLETTLQTEFGAMNGFSSLNVTKRTSGDGLDFVVNLSATFKTTKVEGILSTVQQSNAGILNINVTSRGLVSIDVPTWKVCYQSTRKLSCTIEEEMNSCMWQISRTDLGTQTVGAGTEVDILSLPTCTLDTAILLLNITSFWAGTYTCIFTGSAGTVSHAASADLMVALLPEEINVTSIPPNPDCSVAQQIQVNVTCSIYKSKEEYTVAINDTRLSPADPNSAIISYYRTFTINCLGTRLQSLIAYCNVTNSLGQNTTAPLDVPIIYPGDPVCEKDDPWPKTKNGSKATILCTEPGRVGKKERLCSSKVWQDPIDLCIKEALNTVAAAAGDFEKGVGATEDGASLIFDNLKNTTSVQNTYGDVKATVNVFSTMSRASSRVTMGETLLPNFIDSASNILNTTWDTDDKSKVKLATSYLTSVEELVKNIRLNTSEGHNASNIQLQVCRKSSVCNRTVFNVEVEVNSSASEVKTIGLQKIASLLPKGAFTDAIYPSLVVSATVNESGPVNIRLAFPTSVEDKSYSTPHCVFWNITSERWSQEGCNYTQLSSNISFCDCDHLTSFSMLLSKTPVDLPFMDQITYIGLGISICSLVVFITIEALVWHAVVKTNLSHFRHTALINISLCLLLADCSFVAATFQNILTDTLCILLTVAQHFFYLAMFFWMLCLSIMLLHQLIFVFHPLRKKVFMILSMTIGYACPTLTVGATYMYYDKRTDVHYYSRSTCWLTYDSPMKGSIHAFLFPLGTIIFINMFSMVVVIVTLLKPAAAESNKKDDKEAAKSIIKVIIFLTPVFGGTWILGLFVFLMDDNKSIKPLIHYSFTIVNSLQGLFILLTGCFGEKRVRDEIVKLVISGRSAKSESKKNLTVSTAKK